MIKEFENIYSRFGDKKSKKLWELALYTNLMQPHSFFKTLIERETLKEKRTWEYKQDLILFGCGKFSEFCLNYFKNSVGKVKVLGFCDNNLEEKQHLGLKSFKLKELRNLKDKIIMITPRSYEIIHEIKEQLLDYGFKKEQILDFHYFANDRRLLKFVDSVDMQYFDKKIVKPKSYDFFIDCGAFTGDTIERFIKFSNNKFKKIIAFEPDFANAQKCKENIAKLEKRKNIVLLEKGTWQKNTTLSFNSNSSSSSFSKNGNLKVKLDSIDNICKNEKVSFIKMDVEGAELESLKGAKNTIIKHKPTLAICVYHRISDLIDIPAYISELVPSYKFYLRCYDFRGWEIVLYAVLD